MPTPFEILIQAKKDTAAIPQTTAELKTLQTTADSAGKTFEQTGKRSENLGRGISRGVQIAQSSLDILAPAIGKIAPEFDNAIRAAQQFGGAMSLAFSFGAPGIAIAALTTAIGLLVQYIQQEQAAMVAAANETDFFIIRMRNAAEAMRMMGTEGAAAAKSMVAYADKIASVEGALMQARQAQAQGMDQFGLIAVRIKELEAELERLKGAFNASYEEAEHLRGKLWDLGKATDDAAAAALRHGVALGQEARMLQEAALATDTLITADHDKQIAELEYVSNRQKYTDDAEARKKALEAQTKAASDAAAAQKRLNDTVMAMVGKALTPTFPTPEEMGIAKAGGATPTHWDELARQAEDVALRPETIEKYGELQKALEETGMSAEAFAKGFRDMSLFADPSNLKFAEMAPVIASVKAQIQSLIGEANLMKGAFDAAWGALTGPEKQKLGEALGMDPTDANNAQKVFEAMSGGEAQQGAKTTSEIAANIQTISGIHTAIIDVEKSSTFDSNLQEVLDDLAKIPASADVVVTITYETAGDTTDTSGAAGAAGAGRGVKAQHGLSMTVPPGFDENFPIRASSGEHVLIVPPGMNGKQLTDWISQNDSYLRSVYGRDPAYWEGIAAQHRGWNAMDWYKNVGGGGAGGGDTYHAPVYKGDQHYNFVIQTNSLDDLMRQARALAAHHA